MRSLIILAGALFALTVLIRAPAQWLLAAAPRSIACANPLGSMWHGSCARLQVPGVALNDVTWTLHPWGLVRGRLELELRSADRQAPGSAHVSVARGQRVAIRDLHANLPVDSGFLPIFPNGWSGQLQLDFSRVEFNDGRLADLEGTATARELAQRSPAMPFGSFELRFAPPSHPDVISGALRDLGGPLIVTGTLKVRNGNEYSLAGLVATRPEVNAELAKAVEFLGASDAQGRRPFSLEGSF